MNLAERVLQARRARGWSRDRLAETAGVGNGTVSRIESGKVVNINNVKKVGAALGLPLQVLLDESGGAMAGLPGWELLTDDERDHIRGLVGAIANARRPALRRTPRRREATPVPVAFDELDLTDLNEDEREAVMTAPAVGRQLVVDTIRQIHARERGEAMEAGRPRGPGPPRRPSRVSRASGASYGGPSGSPPPPAVSGL